MDSKEEEDQELIKEAPMIGEFLNLESQKRINEILNILNNVKIEYELEMKKSYFERTLKRCQPLVGAAESVGVVEHLDSLRADLLVDTGEWRLRSSWATSSANWSVGGDATDSQRRVGCECQPPNLVAQFGGEIVER